MGRHECVTDPSHSGSVEQGDDRQRLPMSDRTLLVQPSMVPNSTRLPTPRVGSPPLAPFRGSLPQLPFFLQASRLETIKCLLRAKQFSEDAISCLTLAQRRGTIDSYQSKWSCLPNSQLHFHIKGYKSALATSLRLIGCWENVWDDTCMTAQRCMSVARLRVKVQSPRWNLSLVLRALMEEPFEPMDRASFKNITLRTVFLVALATAQRMSELHALYYEKIAFNKERGRSNWHPCQASWRRTRRLTPLGIRLLSLPCQQLLIKLFLTKPYAQSGH
jgi:hypothetical protein